MAGPKRSDLDVGLFLVTTIVAVVAVLVATSGWGVDKYDIFVRTNDARDIAVDTKVFLQGLEIGRVKSVSPRFGGTGPVTFLVQLELNQRFANDSFVRIPKGTIARIADAGFVGGKAISLEAPATAAAQMLAEGDTITGLPKPSPLGQIAEVADSLARQVSLVLTDTRHLLTTVDNTVQDVRGQVNTAAPHLQSTLAEVDAGLRHLEPTLRHAASLASTADSGFGPLQDSITRTMGSARLLLMRLDTLTSSTNRMAGENRADIRATVAQMKVVGFQLENFLDQVSRRPLRMITGVHPANTDSLRAAQAAIDTTARPSQ